MTSDTEKVVDASALGSREHGVYAVSTSIVLITNPEYTHVHNRTRVFTSISGIVL